MSASNARGATLLLAAAAVSIAGCGTTGVLRRHTTSHARTAMDIHQRQVLDNLAKFVYDPHSMPSFSIASSGQTSISDQASGGLNALGFDRLGFDAATLSATGRRQATLNWSLKAITDPRRLELMRCAFQIAVANCKGVELHDGCPDCERRFNRFYTGQAYGYGKWRLKPSTETTDELTHTSAAPSATEEIAPPGSADNPDMAERADDRAITFDMLADPGLAAESPRVEAFFERLTTLVDNAALAAPVDGELTRLVRVGDRVPRPNALTASGEVTKHCLTPGCCNWFCWGPKKCVPRDCDCLHVGHYCGTYVWVKPGRGREELAKLTLAILDYAVNDPPTPRSKQVVLYRAVGPDGVERPATKDSATKVVTVSVPTSSLGEQALAYPDEYRVLYPAIPTPDDLGAVKTPPTISYRAPGLRSAKAALGKGANMTAEDRAEIVSQALQLGVQQLTDYSPQEGQIDILDELPPIERDRGSNLIESDLRTYDLQRIQEAAPGVFLNPILED